MMSGDLIKLIERAKSYIPSGASFTGDLSERVRQLYSMVGEDLAKGVIQIEPGDYIRVGSEVSPGISLAAPIGYDVWYLHPTENALGSEDEERTDEILERMDDFLSCLQDIKPLKTVRSLADLEYFAWPGWYSFWNYWENNAPYMIKVMRYESILKGRSFKYYSQGMPVDSVGYLAFPIGQLGVMEIVSMIGESVTEADDFEVDSEDVIIDSSQGMMAPMDNHRGHCIGSHLIENGYLVQDNVELMAEDFEGQELVEPHRWLRYWIQSEDTFPVPGEFVVLLAKPELFHVIWYQATYPFLYSGQYWENEYYTSGIVKEIIEPHDEELTNNYKVWVRGYEMYLRSSDFLEYEEGDRVAIVKSALGLSKNMDWTQIDGVKNNESSSAESPDDDWVIAPISFYEGG